MTSMDSISVGNSPDKSNELSFYDNTDSDISSSQRCPHLDITSTSNDNGAPNFQSSNNDACRVFHEADFNAFGYDVFQRRNFSKAEPSKTAQTLAQTRIDINSAKTVKATLRNSGSCFRPLNSIGDSTDGCVKLLDMESLEEEDSLLPSNIDSVISGEFKKELRTKRTQRITNSIENDETVELKLLAESPINRKRWKSENKGKENIGQVRHVQQKSVSMFSSSPNIMKALSRDNVGLIGDFSKPFSLPMVINGDHCDLKSISVHTLAKLLNGDYQIDSYRIIDCRYPYEYNGGHIRGAENIFTHDDIVRTFLTKKTETATGIPDEPKRKIIIFHCEFSSQRGPKLLRFLRRKDREVNSNMYPSLYYPEIYLLHHGYKEFFNHYSDLCDPKAYTPMLEPSHDSAYRYYRAQKKNWNCERIPGSSKPVKLRQRFML